MAEDIPDALPDRIQRRLDRLQRSARSVSLAAGLGADGVRNILRGKSASPRGATLKKLAKELECPVEYLLGNDADLSMSLTPDLPEITLQPPAYLAVQSIVTGAGAGGGRFVEAEYLGPPKYFEEALLVHDLRASPRDLGVIEVEGQSMEPLLHNRDQVLFDRRKRVVNEPGLFVLFDGEGVVCKWVQRIHGSDPQLLRIKSENVRFDPYEVIAEQAQVLGRVVWFARRM